jgi:hypothetical protein
MSTVMWEARAADGHLDELVEHVVTKAPAGAQIYRSDEPDPRVVVIDPSGQGLGDVPARLVTRAPHQWAFKPVPRRRG